jgi:hypothetical protein
VIVDDIEGSGQHDARLHWLASDLSFEAADAPFQVIFNAGQSRIRWNIFSSVPGTPAIVRAGKRMQFEKMTSETSMPDVETQLLGWQSPTYGDLQPAVSLVYETRSLLPVRFITVILTDEACQLESRNNGIIISQHDSEIYRVDLSAGNIRTAKTQPNAPTA